MDRQSRCARTARVYCNQWGLRENARGEGVGGALLQGLIESSEKQGIWTLQAGIFADNKSSRTLFERCGFRLVGVRERLGRLNDVWVDVLLMERRSDVVGG